MTGARPQEIALKVLDERIRPHLPAYATAGSAGLDLRASPVHWRYCEPR